MSQGRFTKEQTESTIEAVKEIIEGLPKSKKMNYFGHTIDIFRFLEAAKEAAPAEADLNAAKAAKVVE